MSWEEIHIGIKDFLANANYVIEIGEYISEMNGYIRLLGGIGQAKAAFVGLGRTTGKITIFGSRFVAKLLRRLQA